MTWYNEEEPDVTADMEEMDSVIGRPSKEDKKEKKNKKTSKKKTTKKETPVVVEEVVETPVVVEEVVETPVVVKRCKKCKRPAADNGKGFCKLCGYKL